MARRTTAEAATTRESLLDAAETLFIEQGVSKTSLEQIARRAGMTRGAVYWHFRNKADLFRCMLARVPLSLNGLIDEINQEDSPSAPLEAIQLACERGFKRLEMARYQRVYSILVHRCEAFDGIDPLAIQAALAKDTHDSLYRQLQLAGTRGALRDDVTPALAAALLQAILSGLFHDWLRHHQGCLSERGGQLIKLQLALITATPRPS